MVDLGLALLLSGIIGARLLHVIADGYFWDYVHLCTDPAAVEWRIGKGECLLEHEPSWLGALLGEAAGPQGRWDAAAGVCRPLTADCWAWARFWAGGLTFYGGFFSALLAGWLLVRVDRFPFWKATDMVGIVMPWGLCFGRLGCVLAGCCFGSAWESPISLIFPPGSAASEAQFRAGLLAAAHLPSLPVHPTQLYEAAGALAIAAFLMLWLHGRKRYDGQVFIASLGLYALLRFAVEVVRADDRGGLLGLSTSQLISLVVALGALVVHRRLSAGIRTGVSRAAAE
jgi:phosphatidylglycerol---prolipoprotein diacylglyceryl transferase